MEMDKSYATKGTANTALGFGIGATALSLLQNGGCGNLNWGRNGCCSDDEYVNRYEARKEAEISRQGNEIALLKAEINTNNKIADVFERTATRIRALEDKVNDNTCKQAVTNQQIVDNINFVDNKFTDVYRAIADGDKAVKCYVDCHFVPGKLTMPLASICPPAAPLCPPAPIDVKVVTE